jgi:hypothetical protein
MINAPVGDEPLDIPRFRERIRKLSDEHLERCGRAAAYMASTAAAYGPVRLTCIQQFEELRAEWRRRHPTSTDDRQAPCCPVYLEARQLNQSFRPS